MPFHFVFDRKQYKTKRRFENGWKHLKQKKLPFENIQNKFFNKYCFVFPVVKFEKKMFSKTEHITNLQI